MAFRINFTNPGISDTLQFALRNTNSATVRLDSLNFDFGRKHAGSFQDLALEQEFISNGATNWVAIASTNGMTSIEDTAGGVLRDMDWSLEAMSDRVLNAGEAVRFRLVGSSGTVPDNFCLIDNLAIFGSELANFEGWAMTYGLEGDDALNTADPDGDGLNNLAEYAFGGNPTNSGNIGRQPNIGGVLEDSGTCYIEYVYARRITAGSALSYGLQQRSDLVFDNWAAINDHMEIGTGPLVPNHIESVTNWIPTTGKSKEFIRVEVRENR